MRMWPIVAAWTFAAAPARADDDELVAKGKDLAKAGAWSQAITTFKQADAQQPRAQNACFIGLAYLRRELWPQAELYFRKCHERASSADPLPEWVGEAEAQLADKLAHENVSAVTLVVTPANTTIVASGFLPDEHLEPGTVHLTPGHYAFSFSAPGYDPDAREITVTGAGTETISVTLHAQTKIEHHIKSLPKALVGAGVLVAGVGVLVDVTKLQSERDQLRGSQQLYNEHSGSFDTWRDVTLGCWIGGALITGVGVYLATKMQYEVRVQASIDPHGGATFGIGWSR
ncbi:MAG: carboxypeptidase-like regulatory domain-containing protein [Kofleriaceae bacterium]